MIEKGTFTDCIIKIGDEIIKAHRIILALNSEVFYKMFEQNGLNESQTGELIITDTTSECFRAMLQFFYTKKIDKEILENNVFDIFAISHKYQVMPLKYECERLMSSKIDTENIVKYCSIINLYDDTSTLEEACKSFFRINIKNLLNSNEWKEIKNNYPKLAIQFLESNIDDTHNK
uniref:BTB domain-containing protein n=1 Tax=Meloidogyne hapla TaxID=6305 RepID=A0A1I8B6C1_MELHA